MSSFLDNQPIQFNSYTSAYDTQLYGAVGMQKQNQWAEGQQKSQNFIDSISGIEVIKPEQKQYLQSALGEMQTNVQKLASGDFASQKIVNQIGGYASKIARDPVVQSAVASTQRYKNGLQEIESAKKSGKGYGIQNEWDFQNKFNKWMSDGDAKSSFSDSYTPFVDITDEFLKMYKEVHPDSTLEQQDISQMTPDGQITVTQEAQRKGVTPEKVSSVVNLLLQRPDVLSQTSINGNYAYKGVPNDGLKSTVLKNYQTQIDTYKKQLQDIDTKGATDNSMTPQQAALKKQQLQDIGAKYTSEFAELNSIAPENFKSALYMFNLKSNLINSFSYSENSLKTENSPVFNAQMQLKNYNLSTEKFKWEQTIKERELADKEKVSKGITGTVVPTAVSGDKVDFRQVFTEQISSLGAQTDDLKFQRANQIAAASGVSAPYKKDPNDASKWIPNVGVGGYDTPEQAISKYNELDSAATASLTNGTAKDYITRLSEPLENLQRQKEALALRQQQIEDQYSNSLKNKKGEIVRSISNEPDFSIPYVGSDNRFHPVNLSPSEILKSIEGTSNVIRPIQNNSAAVGGMKNTPTRFEINTPQGWKKVSGIEANGHIASLYNKINNPETGQGYSQALDIANKSRADSYKSSENAVGDKAMLLDGKTKSGAIREVLLNLPEQEQGADNIKAIIEATQDLPKQKLENNTFSLRMQGNDYYLGASIAGKPLSEVKLSSDRAQAIIGGSLPKDEFFDRYGKVLALSGGLSTNIGNKGWDGAFSKYTPVDNPYSVKYDVIGSEGNYALKLYVKDKKNGRSLYEGLVESPAGSYMSSQQLLQLIDNPIGISNKNFIDERLKNQ